MCWAHVQDISQNLDDITGRRRRERVKEKEREGDSNLGFFLLWSDVCARWNLRWVVSLWGFLVVPLVR